MVECITLKTTPSYESDFLFHAKLQTAFQTKWEQNILCTRVVLCCCFFLTPCAASASHRFFVWFQKFKECFMTYRAQKNLHRFECYSARNLKYIPSKFSSDSLRIYHPHSSATYNEMS